jgi:hypothetical protein
MAMVKPPYFGVLRLFLLAEQGDRTLGLATLPRPAPFFGGVYHIRTQCNKAACMPVRPSSATFLGFACGFRQAPGVAPLAAVRSKLRRIRDCDLVRGCG